MFQIGPTVVRQATYCRSAREAEAVRLPSLRAPRRIEGQPQRARPGGPSQGQEDRGETGQILRHIRR